MAVSSRHCLREQKKEYGQIGGLWKRHLILTEGGCLCDKIDGMIRHPATQEFQCKRTSAETLINLKLPSLDVLDPNTNFVAEHRLTVMRKCQEEILNRMETFERQYIQVKADLASVTDKVVSDYHDQKLIHKKVIHLENEVFEKRISDSGSSDAEPKKPRIKKRKLGSGCAEKSKKKTPTSSARKSTSSKVPFTDARKNDEVLNKKEKGTPTTSSAASDGELIVDEKCKKSPLKSNIVAQNDESVEQKLKNSPAMEVPDKKTTVSIKSHPAITTVSKPVEATKGKEDEIESAAELSPIPKNAFERMSKEELIAMMIKLRNSGTPEKAGEEKDDDK